MDKHKNNKSAIPKIERFLKEIEKLKVDVIICRSEEKLQKIIKENKDKGFLIKKALYGIADSGTCIMKREKDIKEILLSEKLLLLIEENNIYKDLFELFQKEDFKEKNYFFITGPSKTADIEKILIIGVHGPCVVKVVIITFTPHQHRKLCHNTNN